MFVAETFFRYTEFSFVFLCFVYRGMRCRRNYVFIRHKSLKMRNVCRFYSSQWNVGSIVSSRFGLNFTRSIMNDTTNICALKDGGINKICANHFDVQVLELSLNLTRCYYYYCTHNFETYNLYHFTSWNSKWNCVYQVSNYQSLLPFLILNLFDLNNWYHCHSVKILNISAHVHHGILFISLDSWSNNKNLPHPQ